MSLVDNTRPPNLSTGQYEGHFFLCTMPEDLQYSIDKEEHVANHHSLCFVTVSSFFSLSKYQKEIPLEFERLSRNP